MGNFKEDIARTEAFIFDVDGVMTDGGIVPTVDGDFIRRYDAKDGYALAYAVRMGYKICIITGGRGRTLEHRLGMLGLTRIYLDCMDKMAAMREFFAEEGVRNVPEWYERKLGVPPQLYAQLPARTIVAVRDAANRRRAFVLDGVRHAQDAGFAGLAESGLSRTLPPEGLAELLDAVMAFLLGDPVREGARPGAVRFVSRVF